MMKIISHRGNLNGPRERTNKEQENNPDVVDFVIKKGYDVEIDIRQINNNLFLGHDVPNYLINLDWLLENKNSLWIHCKNLEALMLLAEEDLNIFWHQNDDFTLTSSGHIWTYPGKRLSKKSIAVMPEKCNGLWSRWCLKNSFAICTDYVKKYEAI